MTSNPLRPREALTELWERRWPECPPFAHWLRQALPGPVGEIPQPALLENPDDDPEYRSYTQLYAETVPWQPGALDNLLRAVADDELANVILAPTDLEWLHHPHDGGADIILATREHRGALKARHRDWLSKQPSGL